MTTNFKSSKLEKPLELSDVGCPICLEILTEPITMPCKHRICRPCFEKTIELSNLLCPFCKIRIGTWCRQAKKIDNIVDRRLWERIKEQFPVLVEARLSGQSDLDTTGLFDVEWSHDICENGVIGREFESQLDDLRKENQERVKTEEKQSEELIRALMREEGLHVPPALAEPPPGTTDSQRSEEDDQSRKLIREILKEENSNFKMSKEENSSFKCHSPGVGKLKKARTSSPSSQPSKASLTPSKGNQNMHQFFKSVPSSSAVTTQTSKENKRSQNKSSTTSSIASSSKRASSPSADDFIFAPNFETRTSTSFELRNTPDFDIGPELGLTVTPELLELQMRLEASIDQQRKDEAMARRLQELEEATSPTQDKTSLKRPRQMTMDEIMNGAKKRKQD